MDGTPPWSFDMLQYFETILPLLERLWLLNKMRYILGVLVLLEACDITNDGCHRGFYQESEIRLKLREMVIFAALREK